MSAKCIQLTESILGPALWTLFPVTKTISGHLVMGEEGPLLAVLTSWTFWMKGSFHSKTTKNNCVLFSAAGLWSI